MNCVRCGSVQADGAAFCSACGNPVQAPASSATPPTQAKPKRSLTSLLAVVAAVILLGAAAAFVLIGREPRSTPKETATAAPKAPATVAPVKGFSVLLNGLQAGSPPPPEMRKVADNGGVLDFVRPNDRTEVLGVPVRDVRYSYVGGKLLFSVTYSVAATNAATLLAKMKTEYGEAEWKDPDSILHWYEPRGATKSFALSAAYFVEANGEAGIAVVSGPVAEKLVEQMGKGSPSAPEPVAPSEGTTPAATAEQTVTPDPADTEAQPLTPKAPPSSTSGHNHKHQPTTDPYTATFCCTIGPDLNVPLASCFSRSVIRVRKGDKVKVYTSLDISTTNRGSHSVDIDLPNSFEIEARNTAATSTSKLLLKIIDNSTGAVVFDQEAPFGGWLRVRN